jgi:hypothetical protein
MNRRSKTRFCVTAICCAVLLVPSGGWSIAANEAQAQQSSGTPAGTAAETMAGIPPEQLDALVAPIALYPDPLLAQVLVASTYPLEIIQLQQWLERNPGIKGDALVDAVAKEPWDPSIQSMAAVPDALERLGNDIQWTTELGNAFLAQQGDVMDAVQRMRQKAQNQGTLESNEQQKVETVVVEERTVIVVESADPEVIYVPSYSPTVVYGPPVYPYPPIYYPPYPVGAAAVTFGVAMVWGAALGGACCGCGWGSSNIDINVNNNFNKNNSNFNKNNNSGRGGGSGNWKHDPQHRGGTPYSGRATADKFGGSARGDSMASRQASARQQAGRQQGGARSPAASTGSMNRSAGSAGGRASQPSASTRGGGSGASRGASGDKIGNRSIPSSSSSKAGGAFGGGSSGFSGSSARSYSSRGSSSFGSTGSRGGSSRGGGGRR